MPTRPHRPDRPVDPHRTGLPVDPHRTGPPVDLRRSGPPVVPRHRGLPVAVALCAVLAACGSPSGSGSTGQTSAPAASTPGATSATGSASSGPATPTATGTGTGTGGPATTSPSSSTRAAGGLGVLRGHVIAIDPGHNGADGAHPAQINRQVFVGNGYKACETTGTQSNAGYPEHAFTWDLANRLAAQLRAAGAQVVLTRSSDDGVGPCNVERAAIGNRAHADLAISLHADGGPATGSGFHVIEPGTVGGNAPIVAPSRRLGLDIRDAFRAGTGEPFANYLAHEGIDVRTDLGGLNMSRVPKVFIECGNMRNAGDAARLVDPAWRQRAAVALATGMAAYLSGR